ELAPTHQVQPQCAEIIRRDTGKSTDQRLPSLAVISVMHKAKLHAPAAHRELSAAARLENSGQLTDPVQEFIEELQLLRTAGVAALRQQNLGREGVMRIESQIDRPEL